MSNDALERLKNKKKPTVKSRDTSITNTQSIQTSRHLDTQTPITSREIQKEKEDEQIVLKTKQTTLRLEESLSEELSRFCREAGFCREVFIEALFEYYQNNKDNLDDVLDEAKKKADLRVKVANQKRAKSMMKKFNSPL